jgi:hypothetical protein
MCLKRGIPVTDGKVFSPIIDRVCEDCVYGLLEKVANKERGKRRSKEAN